MAKFTIYPGNTINYVSKKGILYKISNRRGSLVCSNNGKRCKPTKEILSKFAVPGGFYTVYTDGGCLNNPGGRGGYGVVIISPSGEITEQSQGYKHTTNNRMELMGAIEGLKNVPRYSKVSLYSDSKYLVLTMQGAYQKTKNKDLWTLLDKECKLRNVSFHWTKGHSKDALNNVCDRLASEAMNKTPLLEDVGYKGKKRFFKSSHITACDKVPKLGNVKPLCASLIEEFYKLEKPGFKDYAKLKTGGKDMYSEMGLSELQSICKANIKDIEPHLKDWDIVYVLRWNCRGLSLKDSIKKVLVDKEIDSSIKGKKK